MLDHKLKIILFWRGNCYIGAFPKLSRTFIEFSESDKSDKSLKHESSSDSVSQMFLTGVVVASWSLTQEVAGSIQFTVISNIFVTELILE